MPTSTISVRLDKNLKDEFDELAGKVGLTASAAVCAFVRQSVARGGFSFDVAAQPSSEREFASRMDAIYEDMQRDNFVEHELVEA